MFLVLAVGGFASCSDDDNVDRYVETGQGVYFSVDTPTSFLLEENASSISLTLYRNQSEGEFEVAVVPVTEHENLFTVPESVIFADGETEAELTIGVKFVRIEAGVSYPLTLTLADQKNLSQFGYNSVDLTVKYDPWTFVGMAKWRDDIFDYPFNLGGSFPETEVELYESDVTPGRYRLKNVYTPEFAAQIFGGSAEDWQGATREGYITFDATDPSRVIIEMSDIGFIVNSGYGWMQIVSNCEENGITGADNLYGTLKDKIITFPAEAILLYLPLYEGGFLLPANGSAKTRIVLPGGVALEPAVAVEYKGILTTPDYEATAIFNTTMNEDAGFYRWTVVPGNIEADAEALAALVDGIKKGTVESTKEMADAECTYLLYEPGDYSAVFVPYSADETVVGVPTVVPFEYTSGGGISPAQFVAQFETVTVDETYAIFNITPNTDRYAYYWDMLPKSDYDEVCAEYGSIEAYSLAFLEYVASSYNVTLPEVIAAYSTKGAIESQVVERLAANTEYVLWAFCINEATGASRSELSTATFTTLEAQPLEADYEALLGTWTITSTKTELTNDPVSFDVTFVQKKSNLLFDVYGWGGNASFANYPVLGNYQTAGEGDPALFYIVEQYSNSYINSSYGTAVVCFFARYFDTTENDYAAAGVETNPAVVGSLSDASNGTVSPWYATSEDGSSRIDYTGADYFGVLIEGDYAGYLLSFAKDFAVGPYTMAKSAAPAARSQKEFKPCMADTREAHLKKVNGTIARREFLRTNAMVVLP